MKQSLSQHFFNQKTAWSLESFAGICLFILVSEIVVVLVNRILSDGLVNWPHVSWRNYPWKSVMVQKTIKSSLWRNWQSYPIEFDFLVQIYPRVNFIPAARLSNFYIDVSNNTDGSSALRCAYEPTPFSASETRVYRCPHRLYGRYVRIRFASNKTQHLQLCEVQIHGACRFITLPTSVPHGQSNK